MKHLTFLISFFVLSSYSFAQEKGQVRFLVNVDNGYFEVVINDTLYLKKFKDSLPAGNYKAEIWSPGYVTENTEFTIESGKTTDVELTPVHNNNFTQYEYDYKEYRNKFHKSLTVPLSVTIASALYSGTVMLRMYNFRKATSEELTLYDLSSSSSEVVQIKERINMLNDKFTYNRSLFYTGSVLTTLFAGYTIVSYLRFKRRYKEPTYNQDSPFKDRFTFIPHLTGFTMQLKFG